MLELDFMQRSLVAGLLASVACGIVGSYVVTRRIVFISGGIAHTAYGGIGLGYYAGFHPMLGAVFFTLGSALIISWLRVRLRQYLDTLIGILWSMGMAVGIVFVALTPRYTPDLMSYLFGSILYVSRTDLLIALGLDVLILLVTAPLFNSLRGMSFDESFCRVRGLPVNALFTVLLCLIGLTVVVLIRVVGIILVIALLTIPPAISREITGRMSRMMVLSSVLGAVFTTGGLMLSWAFGNSFELNLPSGALIILLATITFLIAVPVARRARGRSQSVPVTR